MADLLLAQQLQAEEDQRALSSQRASLDRHSAQNRSALFLNQLSAGIAQVKEYEDDFLQALALSALPNRILSLLEAEPVDQDNLAQTLLSWFKQNFFKWVTKPDCQHCGLPDTKFTGGSPAATPEEVEGRCRQVENYLCAKCNRVTRFPRYNHPGKLLETRQGRCGEFANAFTLICRATGLEARWCRDWTDHVWTEFYSLRQSRWIHLDPCENAFDQPHLYEAGWGKKLSYVIAFGRLGVMDVSRRYSTDPAATQQRQAQIAEPHWVQQVCARMTGELRRGLPESEDRLWAQRDQQEAVELVQSPRGPADAESMPGRETGSTEWKISRGELGNRPTATGSCSTEQPPDTTEFQPTSNATADETIHMHDPASSSQNASLLNGQQNSVKAEMTKDEFTSRMQAAFAKLMASGRHAPGDAAALALKEMLNEHKEVGEGGSIL